MRLLRFMRNEPENQPLWKGAVRYRRDAGS
jgi:hypothetical protein